MCIFNGVISLCLSLCHLMTFCFFGMEDMDEKVASKRICTALQSKYHYTKHCSSIPYFALLLFFVKCEILDISD